MQDAFAVRRMTCCSAFTAEKIGEKCFPDGKRRPFCYVAGTLTDENLAHDPAMKAHYILICVIRITRVISIACAPA